MHGKLAKVEGKVTMLNRLLIKTKEKASLSDHRASAATIEVVEAFRKEKELLKSCEDAFTKDIRWYKRKIAKYYPELNLGMLSSEMSSSNGDLNNLGSDEGGEAMPPPDFCFLPPLL